MPLSGRGQRDDADEQRRRIGDRKEMAIDMKASSAVAVVKSRTGDGAPVELHARSLASAENKGASMPDGCDRGTLSAASP